MAKRLVGFGCINRRHRYTITVFNTADEVMAHGRLKETGWGRFKETGRGTLELETEDEMEVTCSGDIGHAIVKRDGDVEWIIPYRTMTLNTRRAYIGDFIVFRNIEEGDS